jgi:hypothetical protein
MAVQCSRISATVKLPTLDSASETMPLALNSPISDWERISTAQLDILGRYGKVLK